MAHCDMPQTPSSQTTTPTSRKTETPRSTAPATWGPSRTPDPSLVKEIQQVEQSAMALIAEMDGVQARREELIEWGRASTDL